MVCNIIGVKWIWVGFFVDWKVIDKIGIGDYGWVNDIVVVWLLIGVFYVVVVMFDCVGGGYDVEFCEVLFVEVVMCVVGVFV